MKTISRIAVAGALAGLAPSATVLNPGRVFAQPPVAGASVQTMNCLAFPSGECTVVFNSDIPAGQTFQVLFPDQVTPLVVTCAGNCFAGESFVVSVTPAMLANGFDTFIAPTCDTNCANLEAAVASTPMYAGT
jgi:hypothetical protein